MLQLRPTVVTRQMRLLNLLDDPPTHPEVVGDILYPPMLRQLQRVPRESPRVCDSGIRKAHTHLTTNSAASTFHSRYACPHLDGFATDGNALKWTRHLAVWFHIP